MAPTRAWYLPTDQSGLVAKSKHYIHRALLNITANSFMFNISRCAEFKHIAQHGHPFTSTRHITKRLDGLSHGIRIGIIGIIKNPETE